MKYTGTKTLDAVPMSRGEYNTLRGWTIPENEDPNDPGYKVVYEDGYISWSPKDTFEKAYRISETPLNRLRIEQEDLEKKLQALTAFAKGKVFNTLEVRMQVMLSEQIKAMSDYGWILTQRIKMMDK